MLIKCPYARKIGKGNEQLIGVNDVWVGDIVEE
jgi:hypothetical protein